jgi:hypothetical protein
VIELRYVTIRKFEQSDLLQTANILAVSFKYMFQKLTNVPENKIADLLETKNESTTASAL